MRCTKKKYMTNLDLTSSYWQIELPEESENYTACMTFNRVLEFNVSAMGIKTRSTTSIRALSHIVSELRDFLLIFVDDVHVRPDTFEEHLIQLEELFKKATEYNFTFKFIKFEFVTRRLNFQGSY